MALRETEDERETEGDVVGVPVEEEERDTVEHADTTPVTVEVADREFMPLLLRVTVPDSDAVIAVVAVGAMPVGVRETEGLAVMDGVDD